MNVSTVSSWSLIMPFSSRATTTLLKCPSHITKASKINKISSPHCIIAPQRTAPAVRLKCECALLICILCVRDRHNHRARSRTHVRMHAFFFLFLFFACRPHDRPIASYNFLFTFSSNCNQQHQTTNI